MRKQSATVDEVCFEENFDDESFAYEIIFKGNCLVLNSVVRLKESCNEITSHFLLFQELHCSSRAVAKS